MTEPKLDWTTADFVNAEDYNRISGNLNELAAIWEQPTRSYTMVTVSTYNLRPILEQIASHHNALAATVHRPAIVSVWPTAFSADVLNTIEGLCAMEYVWDKIALMEVSGQGMVESQGRAVRVTNAQKEVRSYQSAYTGRQIDDFVERIKEWNNGKL